jgi:hypothetical protein
MIKWWRAVMPQNIELRDYQVEIVEKACEILSAFRMVYLAMEVRTGKTLTSLAIAEKRGIYKLLFVTKKKAIADIEKQAEHFPNIQVDVINYDQLHNVKDTYGFVIVDEAHSLGAFPKPSERARELKKIAKYAEVVYLSGTPTPESWSQIYHQLWISNFSPFKSYDGFYRWAEDFVILKKKYVFNRAINDYSCARLEKIKPITDKIFITFTQEEAGFKQMVQEEILTVRMAESTYKFADRLRIDKIVPNKDGEVVLADTAVKLMNKMHQIYSGSVIVDEPERRAAAFDHTKAEFIRDTFQNCRKFAIYYKFIAEAVILQWVFAGRIFTDPHAFAEVTDGVFISQIQSGREGINLSTAEALVFYNIDFSAVSYWQARARLQTKDREAEAKIYWVFAEGGIEHKIYKAVMDKKDYTLDHFKKDYRF